MDIYLNVRCSSFLFRYHYRYFHTIPQSWTFVLLTINHLRAYLVDEIVLLIIYIPSLFFSYRWNLAIRPSVVYRKQNQQDASIRFQTQPVEGWNISMWRGERFSIMNRIYRGVYTKWIIFLKKDKTFPYRFLTLVPLEANQGLPLHKRKPIESIWWFCIFPIFLILFWHFR